MNDKTAIFLISERGRVLSGFVPNGLAAVAGVRPENVCDWFSPADSSEFMRCLEFMHRGGSDNFYTTLSLKGDLNAKVSVTAVKLPMGGGSEYVVSVCPAEKEAMEFLESVLDNLPSLVFVRTPSPEARYLYANKEYCRLVGHSREELIGGSIRKAFPDSVNTDEIDKYTTLDAAAIESGDIIPAPFCFSVNGNTYIYETLRKAIPFWGGKPAILGVGYDVTDRARMEDERGRMLEDLQKYSKQEGILNTCLKSLISDLDFPEVMRRVMVTIMNFTNADYAGVYKFNEDYSRDYAQFVWTRDGAAPLIPEGYNYYKVRPEYKWFIDFQNGVPMVMEDIDNYELDDETREQFGILGLKSLISVPVFREGKLWGMTFISYSASKRAFPEFDVKLMQSITSAVEIAILKDDAFQKLRLSEREKGIILENINIPVLLFDAKGGLIRVNNATAAFFGKTKDQIIADTNDAKSCSSDSFFVHCPVLDVMDSGKPFFREYSFNERTFIVSCEPIFSEKGELLNIVESIIDTTMQTRAKEEIEHAKEAAEASNRVKSEFLSTMSHEVRTPLNAIIGLSDLMCSDESAPELVRENAHAINSSGHSLLTIINDVLELSKIEADKLNIDFEWMNLNETMRQTGGVFTRQAAEIGIGLSLPSGEGLPEIRFSASALRKIMLNLIGNSMKFTKEGGVEVSCASRPGKIGGTTDIVLKVKDTGCGIPENDQKLILDPFGKAFEKNRSTALLQGSGLGLSIVSRLVKKLGGEISLKSEVGKGSEFTVKFFGLESRKAETGAAPLAETRAVFGMTPPYQANVWVLDDIEMNCMVISALLKKIGVKSDYMTSPLEALGRVKAGESPDLILSDLWMPEMDGERFVEELRKLEKGKNIPVVAVTADTEAKDNFSLEEFSLLLFKPVTADKLKKVILEESVLEK